MGNKQEQLNCIEVPQRPSLEDDVLLEEFCCLIAAIAMRILASGIQKPYNNGSTNESKGIQ